MWPRPWLEQIKLHIFAFSTIAFTFQSAVAMGFQRWKRGGSKTKLVATQNASFSFHAD